MDIRIVVFPLKKWWLDGGKLVAFECDIGDVIGSAESRLPYDEDCVDVSRGIFALSNDLMMNPEIPDELMVFPSRRWRNFRDGETITQLPSDQEPLIFLGNPVRLWRNNPSGCTIVREPSYLIKSGQALGY